MKLANTQLKKVNKELTDKIELMPPILTYQLKSADDDYPPIFRI